MQCRRVCNVYHSWVLESILKKWPLLLVRGVMIILHILVRNGSGVVWKRPAHLVWLGHFLYEHSSCAVTCLPAIVNEDRAKTPLHVLLSISHSCSEEIPLHFFTGEHKDDSPRLCIGGYMVFDHALNGAGRGLNLASIEPKTGTVSSVAHFDTYQDGRFLHFLFRMILFVTQWQFRM